MNDFHSRLARLDSCVASDALDKLGLTGVVAGLTRLSTDGKLAGSVLTQDVALKNFMALAGASLVDAVRSLTLSPAETVGLESELGSITSGKLADLVLLDRDLNPVLTLVNGEIAYKRS